MGTSTETTPEALLALARAVAREAADLVEEHRAAGVAIADTKSSATDIVTEADRASEDLIRGRILGARPDDAFLGEETGVGAGSGSGVRWLVDPIDGTVNYAHGLGQYAVSIAAELDGEVVAGVVLDAATGTEYRASRDGGAFRDDVPIRCAAPVEVAHGLVGTGFNYEVEVRTQQAAAVARLLPRVADIRRFGSCALDLCAVAAGQLDAYVEEGIGGPWDYAAGGLIAIEAGARVTVTVGALGRILVIAAPEPSYPAFETLFRDCGYLA